MPSWVIVGASRGIGYQYLKTLSTNHSNVVIGIARTPSTVEAKVKADGLQNVHIIYGDLSIAATLNEAAKKVSSITNGVLDHLIVNGAYISMETVTLTPPDYVGKEKLFMDEVHKSILTNTAGTLFSVNAFLPMIKKSSIKKVVALSAPSGELDAIFKARMDDGIPYAISKAAIAMVMTKFAITYKDEGIKFLSLNPGFVYTFTDSLETMPEMVKPAFAMFVDRVHAWDPSFERPILPAESVEKQLKVIDGLTMEQSGQLLGHHGDKRWV